MYVSIQTLFEEHSHIMNALQTGRDLRTLIGKNDSAYTQSLQSLIRFFRGYADQYHHFKEEEILFPEMCKKNEMLETGVIQEMLENHVDFREMIRGIEENLNNKLYLNAQNQLEKYAEALLDHIGAENDEVFQMAESLFNEEELEKIYFRMEDCDRNLGIEKKQDLLDLSREIRNRMVAMD